jgi:hypothetical protein
MIFNATTLLLLLIGFLLLLWYCMVLGYMYPMIGNADTQPFYSFVGNSHLTGMILGTCMLGCMALGAGAVILSSMWLEIDMVATIAVSMAILAFGASMSALSIASISH